MAFIVGEKVVAQLKGGQSGNKNVSPILKGIVEAVNGTQITVAFDVHNSQEAKMFFPGSVVDEQFLMHG